MFSRRPCPWCGGTDCFCVDALAYMEQAVPEKDEDRCWDWIVGIVCDGRCTSFRYNGKKGILKGVM